MTIEAEVYLSGNALEGIIKSVCEIPTKEVMGYCHGNLIKSKKLLYEVSYVSQLQDVLRYPNSINSDIDDKISRWSLTNNVIGDFHSHVRSRKQNKGYRRITNGFVSFSKTDSEVFKNYPEDISLVIAINKLDDFPKSIKTNHFTIKGIVNLYENNYKVDIGAYWKNGRVRRAKIKTDKKMLKLIS